MGFFRPTKKYSSLEIAFHREAAHHGEHGQLEVSSRRERLSHNVIAFAFKSVSEVPALTPELLIYIWEEAKAQGYVPHEVISYGNSVGTSRVLDPVIGAAPSRGIDTFGVAPRGPVTGLQPMGQVGQLPQGFPPNTIPQQLGSVPMRPDAKNNDAAILEKTLSPISLPAAPLSQYLTGDILNLICQVPDFNLLKGEVKIQWTEGSFVGAVRVPSMISSQEPDRTAYRLGDVIGYETVRESGRVDESFFTAIDVLELIRNPSLVGIPGYLAIIIKFVNSVALNDLAFDERAEFTRIFDEFVEQGLI